MAGLKSCPNDLVENKARSFKNSHHRFRGSSYAFICHLTSVQYFGLHFRDRNWLGAFGLWLSSDSLS